MFGHTTVSIIGPGRTGFLGGSLFAKTPLVVAFAMNCSLPLLLVSLFATCRLASPSFA